MLLLGDAGAGKSDLALQLVTTAFLDNGSLVTIRLISDDQVSLSRSLDDLIATPPPRIAGKIEVRGIGILPIAFEQGIKIVLAIAIRPAHEIERLPQIQATHTILDVELPLIAVDGSKPGAPSKIVMAALQCSVDDGAK